MVQDIVTFIGLYTCYFMTASHPVLFAHPLVCTPVVTLTLDFKIYPKFVSLPVLGSVFSTLFSTVFSKTSSGTVSSAAGPLRALSFRCVFPTVLNQRTTPFAGSLRPILCPSGVSFKRKQGTG